MIEDFYNNGFIQILQSQVSDEAGSYKNVYYEIDGSDFAGSLTLNNANNSKSDDRAIYNATHKMDCPVNVGLVNNDIIRDKFSGKTYKVLWEKNIHRHHLKVLLKEFDYEIIEFNEMGDGMDTYWDGAIGYKITADTTLDNLSDGVYNYWDGAIIYGTTN